MSPPRRPDSPIIDEITIKIFIMGRKYAVTPIMPYASINLKNALNKLLGPQLSVMTIWGTPGVTRDPTPVYTNVTNDEPGTRNSIESIASASRRLSFDGQH